jgi:hypothetical protein
VDDWITFAVVVGGAAGALIGLLFVAVSIRADAIMRSKELRSRAAQTLTLFLSALVIAMVLSIPGQSERALGIELIGLAVVTAVGLIVLDRRARSTSSGDPLARLLEITGPYTITTVLLVVSGALLAADLYGGFYVLVACVLVDMVGGVASAWLFVTQTAGSDPTTAAT